MAAPLSKDIRKRIMQAKERGDRDSKIAKELQVSQSVVTRLLALYKETGSIEPRPLNNGRKPRLNEEMLQTIRERIERQPDISLRELIEGYDLRVSEPALCKTVNRKLGLRRKKTVHAAEQKREDVKAGRVLWSIFQKEVDPAKLVVLDESGVNTRMTRLYGRARKQDRVVDTVPDVRFHRTTILSSMRLDGTIVPCVFENALNGDLFREYIRQFLVPTLHPGDIVVMDNLSSHKVRGVVESIEAVGASVLFLPPYSPDFNPIELMWSKIKAILRKLKVRNKHLLDDAIAFALNSVSPSDICGWFSHSGYLLR